MRHLALSLHRCTRLAHKLGQLGIQTCIEHTAQVRETNGQRLLRLGQHGHGPIGGEWVLLGPHMAHHQCVESARWHRRCLRPNMHSTLSTGPKAAGLRDHHTRGCLRQQTTKAVAGIGLKAHHGLGGKNGLLGLLAPRDRCVALQVCVEVCSCEHHGIRLTSLHEANAGRMASARMKQQATGGAGEVVHTGLAHNNRCRHTRLQEQSVIAISRAPIARARLWPIGRHDQNHVKRLHWNA